MKFEGHANLGTVFCTEGTLKFDSYPKETVAAAPIPFSDAQIELAKRYASAAPGSTAELDPRIALLVDALIGKVADKWTLLVIEALMLERTLRFGRIAERVPGISQKMLTQTLRHMERDGLVDRTVYAVVPPKVEYTLTPLGMTLSAAFCGVWVWAQENLQHVEAAQKKFDEIAGAPAADEPGRTIVRSGVRRA